MHYDSDGLNFLAHFWWLAFPLCWLGLEAAKGRERTQRDRQIMDLAKSYADQGKEPPAHILDALRQTNRQAQQRRRS